jgi:1,4-dihydroxy-6-naphthoate synthase
MNVSLGFSPCPNDTFIFHALVHGVVGVEGLTFEPRMEDVETLNRLALEGALAVTKVSYGAVPFLLDRYRLLRSGGALGRGCGPLVVAREEMPIDQLRTARIAIPGRYTTANLLLRLHVPDAQPGVEMEYSRIMEAVARGEVDAGLIIHESRFTYPEHGLVRVVDLGEWWERETGAPIPLGGIMIRNDLSEVAGPIQEVIRRSVEHAMTNPEASVEWVRHFAQEMSEEVIRSHIQLYVNDFSVDVGAEGSAAIAHLLQRSHAAGLIASAPRDLFVPSGTI